MPKLIGVAFVLTALVLCAVAYYLYEREVAFERSALRAEGVVVRLLRRDPRKVGEHATFAAVVDFTDSAGVEQQFVERSFSYPASHSKGEKVGVWYAQNDPQNASVDEFMDRFGFPVILSGMSAVFLLVGGALALF